MDKYKKYYGVIIFCVLVAGLIAFAYKSIVPKVDELKGLQTEIQDLTSKKDGKNKELSIVKSRIEQINKSNVSALKKLFSPVESGLGDDTLFFTLYNDVIEMVHANSVKIKAIDYTYNPNSDKFVQAGKDVYFVCDVNMELVSNYVNLGKLLQDLYQYPYYIKINEIDVKPYEKDKKILLTTLSLRLYAHTAPSEEDTSESQGASEAALDGAETPLPQ